MSLWKPLIILDTQSISQRAVALALTVAQEAQLDTNTIGGFIGISQQLIAAYEAGTRKISASFLPTLARLFTVPLEQLVGIEPLSSKRGSASTLQRQMEQISSLPKGKQKFITEILDALIKQ